VYLSDAEKEQLTRILESFAQEFAARSGEQNMREEFRRVDLDKSGSVDKGEFRHALEVSFNLRAEDAALLEKRFFPEGVDALE